jgi:hypothetical protein
MRVLLSFSDEIEESAMKTMTCSQLGEACGNFAALPSDTADH